MYYNHNICACWLPSLAVVPFKIKDIIQQHNGNKSVATCFSICANEVEQEQNIC